MNEETDTPRSDRAALVATHHERGLIDVVDLEFAEKLERELTAAKDEATKHISLYHQTCMKLETALFGKESDTWSWVVERLKSEIADYRRENNDLKNKISEMAEMGLDQMDKERSLKRVLAECKANLVSPKQSAARYDALRKLTVREYTEISFRNLRGENFDKLVDELIENRQKSLTKHALQAL